MKQTILKQQNRSRRRLRTRAKVVGTKTRPRLVATITGHHVIAQIIDDSSAKTLVHASSIGHKLPSNLSTRATFIGGEIAKKAGTAKIKQVVFDRGPRRYHGRVKLLAEAARAGGLEF